MIFLLGDLVSHRLQPEARGMVTGVFDNEKYPYQVQWLDATVPGTNFHPSRDLILLPKNGLETMLKEAFDG